MKTATSAPAETEFSGQRAFELLRAQCRLGPRPPGTQAHEQCLDWITAQCRALDLQTSQQSFRADIPLLGKAFRLTNVLAVQQPPDRLKAGLRTSDKPRRILLSAHWDTRPIADRESDPARARVPILGANDGASGVAVLLELARVFKQSPNQVGVVFAFYDGEDSGDPLGGGYCLGSQYLAAHMQAAWDFEKGINLDMVGDRDLSLPIERNSWDKARPLAAEVWKFGAALYPSTFLARPGPAVIDDHSAFLNRGKPCIDVIDFDYAYWHTLGDTEDKCSPESLERVGRALAAFVQAQR
jgi:Zn-dependent M28 family amino/carboxypeptidase